MSTLLIISSMVAFVLIKDCVETAQKMRAKHKLYKHMGWK